MFTLSCLSEVNGDLVRALKSLYKDSKACVRGNGAYSDWSDIRQDSVPSPLAIQCFHGRLDTGFEVERLWTEDTHEMSII